MEPWRGDSLSCTSLCLWMPNKEPQACPTSNGSTGRYSPRSVHGAPHTDRFNGSNHRKSPPPNTTAGSEKPLCEVTSTMSSPPTARRTGQCRPVLNRRRPCQTRSDVAQRRHIRRRTADIRPTVSEFITARSDISRRGLGFDAPDTKIPTPHPPRPRHIPPP